MKVLKTLMIALLLTFSLSFANAGAMQDHQHPMGHHKNHHGKHKHKKWARKQRRMERKRHRMARKHRKHMMAKAN